MQCFTYVHSYVSMEKHLDSCESRLQERISEVETLKKQVCITLNCEYKPVYTLYVRTFVHICMCVNYILGRQHGQVLLSHSNVITMRLFRTIFLPRSIM